MQYNKIKNEIRSPLRYPGGKTKAQKHILPRIPYFKEFREPFVGGGSTFIATKQRVPATTQFVINDLYYDLYCFWNELKLNGVELINAVQDIKDNWNDGKELFNYLRETDTVRDDFKKAVRFFVLNRITFSGLIESGGYSNESFHTRFTQSSIDRLMPFPEFLQDVSITGDDYEELILKSGKEVFIFLDPPYLSATDSRLYGKNGALHTGFNHERFAEILKKCSHKWLITYDDSPEVRKLFDFAIIEDWSLQYGMNNYKQVSAKKGKEVFISNYPQDQKKICLASARAL